jgi:iron complex outermembrane receptor protein
VVGEEKVTNYEIGIKSLFWDGRAQISAAAYIMDWEDITAPNIDTIIEDGTGEPKNVQVNGSGGTADMSGLELEGTVLLTEHLSLEGTISIVKSDIQTFLSPDANRLLGDFNIDGFGNAFSRYPEESGTLSLTYENDLTLDHQFFVRGDLIYQGPNWMTNANITEVGAVSTFNLRAGVLMDDWRIEVYGTNIFDEEGYTATQFFPDFSGRSSVPPGNGFAGRMLFAGLIPRAAYGVRASFFF